MLVVIPCDTNLLPRVERFQSRWLTYHDKDTNGLPGMLPLAIGMRVALTHKLDESPEKRLLKHSVGRVHSWVWEDGAPHPSVIYLNPTWKLDGVDEPGVYPVKPKKLTWYLDNKRQKKVLKVERAQLPLTPAYAMTAHSSQGKTLRAVLLDLSVDKRVDTTFGAVAASRVASRHDCLILRPFEHWLFERGVSEGPQLLLQQLRGEQVDWTAYKEGLAPWSACKRCRQVKTLDCYEHEQWEQVRANKPAMCMQCKHGDAGPRTRKLEKDAKRIACSMCKITKIEDAFPRAQLKQTGQEKCLSCCQSIKRLRCSECREAKSIEHFDPSMATLPAAGIACKECQDGVKARVDKKLRKDWFTCRTCAAVFLAAASSNPASPQRCLNCASRGTRQKDEQTCRGCKRRFHEKQVRGRKRSRRCPDCRRK